MKKFEIIPISISLVIKHLKYSNISGLFPNIRIPHMPHVFGVFVVLCFALFRRGIFKTHQKSLFHIRKFNNVKT